MVSVTFITYVIISLVIPTRAMSPNHLLQRSLSNSFFALRHGQSLANVAKIISSDPKISTVEHGLSDVGKEQAKAAGEGFAIDYLAKNHDYEGVAIYSSDFTRARETAEIFCEELKKKGITIHQNGIILETRLRERYFGELNGGSDNRYQDVWDIDMTDANHNEFGVESANSVLDRTSRLICELDDVLQQTGQRWKCVVVAHGDVLQILQTGVLRHEDASRHRSLQHLETATIRELKLGK